MARGLITLWPTSVLEIWETAGLPETLSAPLTGAGDAYVFWLPSRSRIESVTLVLNAVGNAVVDFEASPFSPLALVSITGGNPPTITGSNVYQNSMLEGWTREFEGNTVLVARALSLTGATRIWANVQLLVFPELP
jgi:hypothetical protein